MSGSVLLTTVAVLALVVAEWTDASRGRWVAKPLASLGFVLTALYAGAESSAFGRGIFLALVLCACGDVLLIPRSRQAFMAGLGSFLAGHLVFATAFTGRSLDRVSLLSSLVVLIPIALAVLRWLSPHVRGPMRFAVVAYVLAIVAMCAAAAGTVGAKGDWRILAGAVAFLVSDLTVARDRFIQHERLNRLLGLPLYYAAQLLLALSVQSSLPGRIP